MRSTVTIMIAPWIMVSTVVTVIPLRVMIPAVAATVTGPMRVMVSLVMVMLVMVVIVVAMMLVIKNRAQCDKRDRRPDNAVIMIRTGWCAGKGQGNQAADRHDSEPVGLSLFHFNLQFISTMTPM